MKLPLSLCRIFFICLSLQVTFSCKKNDSGPAATAPVVTTTPLTNITTSSATAGGTILTDGNASITQSGIVWSKITATPTLNDSVLTGAASNGSFTITLTGLDLNAAYYIRAFATNTVGTGYGDVVKLNFTTDTSKVRFTYNGKEVVYGIIVSSVTGKKWLDRNLGASRVATAVDDHQAYGDLFQWGRPADGHQLINWTSSNTATPVNGTTSVLATSDSPGHSNFITPPYSTSGVLVIWDWRSDNNSNRWITTPQGPCPAGWHVPNSAEWAAELSPATVNGYPTGGTAGSDGMKDRSTAYGQLRLTVPGYRIGNAPEMGQLGGAGRAGFYWSSTDRISNLNGYTTGGQFEIGPDYAMVSTETKSQGLCVRCLMN